ncbi:MAG TPA: glycosyltransferase family 39 protein [Chloroflexota bacterium]
MPLLRIARGRTWLIGLCGLFAFAQTLAYAAYLRDDPGNYNGAGAQGDQVAYIDLAQQVLHGTWQGAVHYMPGLPAVIAVGQLIFGDARLGIAVIQALVYALLVVLAARLAAAAFGEGAATWAAAAVGLNPALGYYAAQALTEFLTAALLLGLAGAVYVWARQPSVRGLAWAGLLVGGAAYLRAEYLALAPLVALIGLWIGRRRAIVGSVALLGVTALVMAPWVGRYALATGTPALYNESPFSNLVLMGTWFRVFDEQTFSRLQQIETAPGPREDAIASAATVGPRPDLSERYMQQARGPYERPMAETLGLALGNIQLNLRQYLVNHLVLAPVLIWAGHTPVRQADAPRLPATGRYAIWAAEMALLGLALWQAIAGLAGARASAETPGSHAGPGQSLSEVRPTATCAENRLLGRTSRGEADTRAVRALSVTFLVIVAFLTAVHILIAVDERFTIPALPLVGLFAGARLSSLSWPSPVLAASRRPT